MTRVHAQSTEGALFRLEHHDETVARVAKRRTFVPASTARARARARARDAAKPSMLIVLLVLRAWYRSALLSPYPRPYNSNDTYMHHRVRILTLSNPVYVHTRCPPRSDARTRSRAFARRRRTARGRSLESPGETSALDGVCTFRRAHARMSITLGSSERRRRAPSASSRLTNFV